MNHPAGSTLQDESTLTPWEAIDPDEPAEVTVHATPAREPDATEALVYRAIDLENEASIERIPAVEVQPAVPAATTPIEDKIPLETQSDSDAFGGPSRELALEPVAIDGPASIALPSSELLAPDAPIKPAEPARVAIAPANDIFEFEISNPSESVFVAASDVIAQTEPACEVLPEDTAGIQSTSYMVAEPPLETEDSSSNEEDAVWEDPELGDEPAPLLTGASWTLPLLCLGIALVACCAVIPQADANRRLAYEKQALESDVATIRRQVEVNDEFLKRVVDDSSLAERLAQRQLKRIRKGQHVLQLNEEKPDMTPFRITSVPDAPPLPPYKPAGGILAGLCNDSRTRLYTLGTAMAMIASGLVLGSAPMRRGENQR